MPNFNPQEIYKYIQFHEISIFDEGYIVPPNRAAESPFLFTLEVIENLEFSVIVENQTEQLRALICEDYWHSSRLTITRDDGSTVPWDNVYPPVDPGPPMYRFLTAREKKVVQSATVDLDTRPPSLRWARAQLFHLSPGRYQAIASWECSYGTRAIYDTHSYEKSWFVSNELDQQWVGLLKSPPVIFEIPPAN